MVAAVDDVEHHGSDLIGRHSAPTVALHQLLDAGRDLAGVVQHRLVGVEGQVGQHHETSVGCVGPELLSDRHRRHRRSRPAGSGDRDEVPTPTRLDLRRLVGKGRLDLGYRGRELDQHGHQLGRAESVRDDGGNTEFVPVPRPITGDENRGAGAAAGVDQVPVQRGQVGPDQEGGVGPPGPQAGPDLVSRDTLDEVDRDGSGGRPAGHLGEPPRPGTGESQHDPALPGRHRDHGVPVPASGSRGSCRSSPRGAAAGIDMRVGVGDGSGRSHHGDLALVGQMSQFHDRGRVGKGQGDDSGPRRSDPVATGAPLDDGGVLDRGRRCSARWTGSGWRGSSPGHRARVTGRRAREGPGA